MVRQAHHERDQPLTVRPEPVEGLNQRFLICINRTLNFQFTLMKSFCGGLMGNRQDAGMGQFFTQ